LQIFIFAVFLCRHSGMLKAGIQEAINTDKTIFLWFPPGKPGGPKSAAGFPLKACGNDNPKNHLNV
jgi:hypothetical protein